MNHTQKKYAQDRVEQLVRQQRARIESEGATKRLPEYTNELKLRMIRDGSAVFLPGRALPSGRYKEVPELFDLFDFPGEDENREHNARAEEETAGRIATMRAAASDLKDELMLGDAVEALAKLRYFAGQSF